MPRLGLDELGLRRISFVGLLIIHELHYKLSQMEINFIV
jgi:hypothetical protein